MRKIDDGNVTRNSLRRICDLALQVFEAGSKTYNAKIKNKSSALLCYMSKHQLLSQI